MCVLCVCVQRAKNYKPSFDDGTDRFLREAKKRDSEHQQEIARRILTEANLMQAR